LLDFAALVLGLIVAGVVYVVEDLGKSIAIGAMVGGVAWLGVAVVALMSCYFKIECPGCGNRIERRKTGGGWFKRTDEYRACHHCKTYFVIRHTDSFADGY